jgi:predicted RNA binding protein YcfA (HicA-like mRNA interferase family)
MKRLDLIRAIERLGCELVRHGAKHDWYRNPVTGVAQAVPRHREIKEHLSRHILRSLQPPDETEEEQSREEPPEDDNKNA